MGRSRQTLQPRGQSNFPSTPTSTSSTLFAYSTARPPTNYSTNSWGHPDTSRGVPPVPEVPSRPISELAYMDDYDYASHSEARDREAGGGQGFGVELNTAKDGLSLYARSDWVDSPRQTGLQEDGSQTPWYARSEFESQYDPTTGVPTARVNKRYKRSTSVCSVSEDEGNVEEDDEDREWEDQKTSWSKSSYQPKTGMRATVLETVYEDEDDIPAVSNPQYRQNSMDHNDSPQSRGERRDSSTLSSVIDLDTIANLTANPFTDYQAVGSATGQDVGVRQDEEGIKRRSKSFKNATPTDNVTMRLQQQGGAEVISPQAQFRLGRMSVAPARYTLPTAAPVIRPSNRDNSSSPENPYFVDLQQQKEVQFRTEKGHNGRKKSKPKPGKLALSTQDSNTLGTERNWIDKLQSSDIGTLYLTYRIFIIPVLTLITALLLSLVMRHSGEMSNLIIVKGGAFEVMPGNGKDVGLGVWGWCPIDGSDGCKRYKNRDFVSASGEFQLPSADSLLEIISNLLTALTTLTFLLGAFQLSTAFFHFFLLFGLSIPFDFFIIPDPLPPLTGFIPSDPNAKGKLKVKEWVITKSEQIQKEVDLRVRTENDPYESYHWVWWAWWAHRRSPMGPILGSIVGLLAWINLGLAVAFYRQVASATADNKVSMSNGLYILVIIPIILLDPVIHSVRYMIRIRINWQIFDSPPSPTAAAILLPPSHKPMKHVRQSGQASFFALPGPEQRNMTKSTLFESNILPVRVPQDGPFFDHPGKTNETGDGEGEVELDPETMRWLALYPHDPDLVGLLADLRNGMEDEQFVVSDVGLLYLKPEVLNGFKGEDGEIEGEALLVPPKGIIRSEILQDIHFELINSSESGDRGGKAGEEVAHWNAEVMLSKLSETFWWPDLMDDCEMYVKNCQRCVKEGSRGIESMGNSENGAERGKKMGSTTLPFTGQTDWEKRLTSRFTRTGVSAGIGESAMAAEMAYAMRKADEDAERLP